MVYTVGAASPSGGVFVYLCTYLFLSRMETCSVWERIVFPLMLLDSRMFFLFAHAYDQKFWYEFMFVYTCILRVQERF
jgi:hypothetical protein